VLDDLQKISAETQNKLDYLEHIFDQSSNLKNKYVKFRGYSTKAEKSEKKVAYIKNFAEINDSRINNIISNKTLSKQKINRVMDIINR